jgi:isoamylase
MDTASNRSANPAARLNSTRSSIGVGASSPLGATVQPDGVNFSVYSKNATLVNLLLFDSADSLEPSRVISLEPRKHRTYHYWHVFVPEVTPGQVYGFWAAGPFNPGRGLHFDGDKCPKTR